MIVKFHFIEILRFITSFAVIVRHYHFFFLPRYSYSSIQILNDPSKPFYFFLQVFYLKGDYAVPIFWGISGKFFSLVYLEQKRKNISSKEFFKN